MSGKNSEAIPVGSTYHRRATTEQILTEAVFLKAFHDPIFLHLLSLGKYFIP
jgi:hypothetical protein